MIDVSTLLVGTTFYCSQDFKHRLKARRISNHQGGLLPTEGWNARLKPLIQPSFCIKIGSFRCG